MTGFFIGFHTTSYTYSTVNMARKQRVGALGNELVHYRRQLWFPNETSSRHLADVCVLLSKRLLRNQCRRRILHINKRANTDVQLRESDRNHSVYGTLLGNRAMWQPMNG